MWGWFAPSCPLDLFEKTWTERRMRWFADRFGIERLLKAEVILPTDDYFPDEYSETLESARRMMHRICGYMGVDAASVRLEVRPDGDLPNAAGHYDATGKEAVIRVAESQLHQPESLAATLAHELAHEILLGGGFLTTECPDHESVTDLLPLYLGLGVFAANSTVHDRSTSTATMSYFWIRRQGYLPSRVFGYAFALFAFVRGETNPPWLSYLRPDAAEPCRAGLQYLRKTNDSLFHPDTLRRPGREPSPRELAERLQHPSPTFRLDALWDVRDRILTDTELVAPVLQLLSAPDDILVGEAAATLRQFGPAAAAAVPLLLSALRSRRDETRASAAYTLGQLHLQADEVIPELTFLLGDASRDVVFAAALALQPFGREAQPAVGSVLPALHRALVKVEYRLLSALAGALHAISPDPQQDVKEYFTDADGELLGLALNALKETSEPCRAADGQGITSGTGKLP
jgi:HEAT repeat protein